MSKADRIFVETCKDILTNGVWDTDQAVRPKWEDDGAPAHTIKKFGVVNRYNLKEEFPILTLRRTYWKTALKELLWIWQQKSNNVNDFDGKVWDQWADETGSIGKAYGYQIAKQYLHHYDTYDNFNSNIRNNYPSAYALHDETGKLGVYLDQIDGVLYDLKNNPASRRIMTNIYNFEDLHGMHLYPCAYSMTFNVSGNTLNGILNQRSQDMLAANNWNVVQYALLMHMVAMSTGLEVGELVHVIADAHIYDRHVPVIERIIENEEQEAPKLIINDVHDFYSFTPQDFKLENYTPSLFEEKIPIAV